MRRQPTLRSQLNQIRLWVRQGRTDAWIAHKLDVSIDQLARFKRDHDLENGGAAPAPPADPLSVPPPEPEPDEPEDEEPEFDEPEEPEDEPEPDEDYAPAPAQRRPRSRPSGRAGERPGRDGRSDRSDRSERSEQGGRSDRDRSARGDRSDRVERDEADGDRPPEARRPSRRRGRRGGRGRRARTSSYEATFDHGDEGYGLWLDPAVVDNPVYAEHWAGHRDVKVTVERDSITIRRAGSDAGEPATDAESD